jgi:hypothetical protein
MALKFERRHLSFRTWFLKRPQGGTGTAAPPAEFCLLLNADPGTDDKTLQLNADPGTDTHCLELNTSTA